MPDTLSVRILARGQRARRSSAFAVFAWRVVLVVAVYLAVNVALYFAGVASCVAMFPLWYR